MAHVIHSIERVQKNLIEKYRSLASATVHEASGGKGALSSRIKPITADMKICGPAITVKVNPKDNLMLHKALYVAQEGDVIVADADGFMEAGAWGEIMAVAAQARGIAGLVFNGAVRDADAMSKRGFPVFSCGLCIKGTTKVALGQINHPLILDNILINPGDLIIGDRDGLVVVAKAHAEDILKKSIEREEKEEKFMKKIMSGESTLDIYGFGEILKKGGLTEE